MQPFSIRTTLLCGIWSLLMQHILGKIKGLCLNSQVRLWAVSLKVETLSLIVSLAYRCSLTAPWNSHTDGLVDHAMAETVKFLSFIPLLKFQLMVLIINTTTGAL